MQTKEGASLKDKFSSYHQEEEEAKELGITLASREFKMVKAIASRKTLRSSKDQKSSLG